MSNIEEIIAEQRARLLRQDGALRRDIAHRLQVVIDELVREAARLPDTNDQNLRFERNAVLQRQISVALDNVLTGFAPRIEEHARAVTLFAGTDFEALLKAQGVVAQAGINATAIDRIGGAIEPASPITRLLAALSTSGADRARQELFTGVALGENPNLVAKRLRKALETNSFKAQRIARTEVLRAYRGSMREKFLASKAVAGWTWISARGTRTCAMCYAMHGTQHESQTAMATHPNCRCSQAPRTVNSLLNIDSGEEEFSRLSESNQRLVLGPAKLKAYQDGLITLPDLVGTAQSADWGQVRYEKSLSSVIGQDQSRAFRRQAG